MRYDTDFSVQYRVDDPVPISDLIESLNGIEAVLRETSALLPRIVDGLEVEHIEIRVRQIAQESPLRELFVLSLFLAFQKDLETEVPPMIEHLTGSPIPHSMDTLVTLLSLIVVFYGVGAIKDFLMGAADDGPSEHKLKSLIAEVAQLSGTSEKVIRDALDARYAEKTAWRRLTNATARFFRPSKRQDSSPLDVNGRQISQDVVRDVPADYLFQDAKDDEVSRSFENVRLELHAQDKDHAGQGWAAIVPSISEKRIKLKLMVGVKSTDLWGVDTVRGDITVIYDRVGSTLHPRIIHLHRLT